MSLRDDAARIQALFGEVRDLPATARHRRLAELGADTAAIAQVEALLAADDETSAIGAGSEEAGSEWSAGDLLGAWRLLGEIGRGGMGVVHLAERADGHFEQRAAIKLMRGIPDAQTFVHFARERQILATLQHPGIARLLDGGATPGHQPYLVMEHVEGEPIDAYCRRLGLGLAARLRLFQKVCEAVQFAHRRFVVHCDLKPSNVLVREDGTPVLLDFGIARALDKTAGAGDRAAAAWITPRYASPEQLRGETVTTASDVFSLGLILFELLAGRSARLDADDHTITLLGRAAVRPSDLAAAMPWRQRLRGDLDAIVQHATASEPVKRYASVDALAADIDRHLALRPVHARGDDRAYRAARFARRHWIALSVAALACVFTGVSMWRIAAERDRALVAERESAIQAGTANEVSAFLVSVFNVSNPRVATTRGLSARDVLDQGATRIGTELDDQPRVKAKLLEVLGTAYRHIGEPARASDLLRQAAALYQSPDVDDPLAAASVLSQLAVVLGNLRMPGGEAERIAHEVLRLRERHALPGSAEMGDAYNTLGVVAEGEDRLDDAEGFLLKALAIRRTLPAGPGNSIGSTLHNLGLVARARDDHAGAERWFGEALVIKRAQSGERSADTQSTLESYAIEVGKNGDRPRAIALLRENLAMAVELYGPSGRDVGDAHNELGSLLHDDGRFNDAAGEYRAALDVANAQPESVEQAALFPLNNLASAYEDMGDYAAAEPLFRDSLERRRKLRGDEDMSVLRAEYNLARVLTRAGKLADARPLIDRLAKGYAVRMGPTHSNAAKAILLEAEWLTRSGRPDDAARVFATLLPSKDPALLARTHAIASRIALAQGRGGDAIREAEASVESARKAYGEQHPLTAEYRLAEAAVQARLGEAAQARDIAAGIAERIEASFAPSSPQRADLQALLASPGVARR
ncbi:tetratricopeptide repeat protein [Dokdonella sp. MW10]|uniref:serine/threonine-protein kinase n=1 Tax=Dokdonella sp. MW10 TaxID=2992926 RepID=UPI003F7F29D9